MSVKLSNIIFLPENSGFMDALQEAQDELTLKTSWSLGKLKKKIQQTQKQFVQKHGELLNAAAQKDENGKLKFSEDGKRVLLEEDKITDFNKQFAELVGITEEYEHTPPAVDLSVLGEKKGSLVDSLLLLEEAGVIEIKEK